MKQDARDKIIPAIDIIGGKCVRLTRGDYARCTTYPGDPLSVASRFEEAGFSRLHLVDLDGARAGKVVNAAALDRVVSRVSARVDFSGGIRSLDDARRVLDAGATWACIGSMAAEQPERVMEWMDYLGDDRLIIMIDVLDGKLRVRGWLEETDVAPAELVDAYRGRIRHLACTDISRDGTFDGPNIPLYEELRARYPGIILVASGGARDLEDVRRLVEAGVDGVIVGKALHEGRISLDEFR
ncbi:MAG: 1-(5-phosphoribosyl)-5-[(5-phosphoribosylamino)methylideneamino] imidazole-4-carboxamide isomerase [Odoribacteraceae bacterium]|jgi:phosphoribosylformimino-5-aminoimidazole carboxamide ribotide isomerase|nr:1-(5-phosphoribosyl)-5-[(5-phosphoribosylamino)methylideneamino] imidazole-4-carboxamide isomerase [Odoribacteraceae bacterium]